MTPSDDQRLGDEALCRSVFYNLLSLALHPPTAEICSAIKSESADLALREAAAVLDASPIDQTSTGGSEKGNRRPDLGSRVDQWIATFDGLSLQLLLSSYGQLFGHTTRGPVCPYETEYGQEAVFQQPRQLAQITGFYRAFGLATRSAERERPDHISCQLEFLQFLSRKEAYALGCGGFPMLEETRKATRLFLRDHLGRYGRAFAHMLREHEPEGFFGRLADLMFDFITFECRRLRIEAGPPLLQLRTDGEGHVPMACGSGESELVQLETPFSSAR
ncbi:MAG: molecular chaperone TorD family protein [Acidobacteria bacterium]|nr:molecular chaperone TorD family protein [Acidobacteriota bacterium]